MDVVFAPARDNDDVVRLFIFLSVAVISLLLVLWSHSKSILSSRVFFLMAKLRLDHCVSGEIIFWIFLFLKAWQKKVWRNNVSFSLSYYVIVDARNVVRRIVMWWVLRPPCSSCHPSKFPITPTIWYAARWITNCQTKGSTLCSGSRQVYYYHYSTSLPVTCYCTTY